MRAEGCQHIPLLSPQAPPPTPHTEGSRHRHTLTEPRAACWTPLPTPQGLGSGPELSPSPPPPPRRGHSGVVPSGPPRLRGL